jgi:lysophospholipase L1-like esterase
MRDLALGLLIASAILLAMEGFSRWVEEDPKYRPSELLAYELIPGYDAGDETVNSHGLRGDEIPPKRPDDFRILAMGGSTTWGHKVDDDETWPVQLERRLREGGSANVQVLNGGVSGWGLEQIRLALAHRYLAALEPDLVLIFSGWNPPALDENPMAAEFRRKNAASEQKHWIYRSALVRRMARRIGKISRALGIVRVDPAPVDEEPDTDRPSHLWNVGSHFPPLLAAIARECRERSVELAVIRYPSLVQVPVAKTDPFRKRFEKKLLTHYAITDEADTVAADTLAQYEAVAKAISDAAATNDIPTLDVASRMRAEFPDLDDAKARETWVDYFRDAAHLTPNGNAAFATALAELLVESEMLRPFSERSRIEAGDAARRLDRTRSEAIARRFGLPSARSSDPLERGESSMARFFQLDGTAGRRRSIASTRAAAASVNATSPRSSR